MILFNTSFHTLNSVSDKFHRWITETYLPAITRNDRLGTPTVLKILLQTDPECQSFAVQFTADDENTARLWEENEGADLYEAIRHEFGDSVMFFHTHMEILS